MSQYGIDSDIIKWWLFLSSFEEEGRRGDLFSMRQSDGGSGMIASWRYNNNHDIILICMRASMPVYLILHV